MGKGYDIKSMRAEIKETATNLENKKKDLSDLEQYKQQLLDSITDISGANIDEKTKQIVSDSLNEALDANKNKGEELSEKIGENISKIEEIKEEIQLKKEEATGELGKISKKQSMLNKFGIGSLLNRATSELNRNISELEDVNSEAIDTMRQLEQASAKAGML